MLLTKPQPVASTRNLRERVDRLFNAPTKNTRNTNQLSFASNLDTGLDTGNTYPINSPSNDVTSFLNFITDAIPNGDVYLFGGVLRDLALLGNKGFNSDIDVVVEGDWNHFVSYLHSLNAHKNKFGGYRLIIGKTPLDIWHAENTWAIKNGYIKYKGIASLTETTVLNWDAILMNWRTRTFIHRKNYFEEISERVLDIVLEANPNPIGMAVRVLRHLYLKDARKLTHSAVKYLSNCAKIYNYEEIKCAEFKSYQNCVIDRGMHRFFEKIDTYAHDIRQQYDLAGYIVKQELDYEAGLGSLIR